MRGAAKIILVKTLLQTAKNFRAAIVNKLQQPQRDIVVFNSGKEQGVGKMAAIKITQEQMYYRASECHRLAEDIENIVCKMKELTSRLMEEIDGPCLDTIVRCSGEFYSNARDATELMYDTAKMLNKMAEMMPPAPPAVAKLQLIEF